MAQAPLTVPVTRHPKGRSVIPDDATLVCDYIEKLPPGWRGTMTLAPEKKVRSVQQNRTVWGPWMDMIMKENYGEPFTKEEKLVVYNEIKMAIGWTVEKVNRKTGEVKDFPRPTKGESPAGYSHFMELVARYAAVTLGIVLENPKRELART